MPTESTEAWVLLAGPEIKHGPIPSAELQRKRISIPEIAADEVLVEPIFGCWEANMGHAVARQPIDVCRSRGVDAVVIGNAGVVRILRVGEAVTTVQAGDRAVVFASGSWDKHGFMVHVLAYDAPDTIGILAKRTKLHQKQVIPIPDATGHSLEQWAGFSLRYITAWANWSVAHRCWLAQMEHVPPQDAHVFGWGGGVAFAELILAQHFGFQTAMMSAREQRLKQFLEYGITPIDRRQFSGLDFQPERYETDQNYRRAYLAAEQAFIQVVKDTTDGEGVSIFMDNIGRPVTRATLKSLARGGVLTTAGWKQGMNLSIIRAIECIQRHIHVHTNYARYEEGLAAVEFAERTGWLPPHTGSRPYGWDEIPRLAADYAHNNIDTFFPLFSVKPA